MKPSKVCPAKKKLEKITVKDEPSQRNCRNETVENVTVMNVPVKKEWIQYASITSLSSRPARMKLSKQIYPLSEDHGKIDRLKRSRQNETVENETSRTCPPRMYPSKTKLCKPNCRYETVKACPSTKTVETVTVPKEGVKTKSSRPNLRHEVKSVSVKKNVENETA